MKILAVVIGNNNYYEKARLDYPVSDASAIAEVFQRLGYDVIFKVNTTIDDCTAILHEFNSRISEYDATIFYFAGHGFQLDGENYLASIDCQIAHANKYHCSKTCILLSEVLDIYQKNIGKINIIIVDACRKGFDRGTSTTFTPIHAPKGTLIAFSTSPNEGAKDGGFEGHSIYTGALLQYIGRIRLSVEELFKKVRKTVYNISEGTQTTWEHTSLIGDFYFNTGQLVYSLEVPYEETVVKDNKYDINKDNFSTLIGEVKSYNYHRQNPAITKLVNISGSDLDKNQQFILGRNLLQAAGNAYNASNFFEKLPDCLRQYSVNGENHLLNGILFEIYFDSYGEFRNDKLKDHCFDEVMALRTNPNFGKSFDFIRNLLGPYRENRYWIPESNDNIIDVDVVATTEKVQNFLGEEETYEVISRVNVFGKDLIEAISKYGIMGKDASSLKQVLASVLNAPGNLIQINSNIEIKRIAFPKPVEINEPNLLWG